MPPNDIDLCRQEVAELLGRFGAVTFRGAIVELLDDLQLEYLAGNIAIERLAHRTQINDDEPRQLLCIDCRATVGTADDGPELCHRCEEPVCERCRDEHDRNHRYWYEANCPVTDSEWARMKGF